MIKPFTYYMHDEYDSTERIEEIEAQVGPLSESVREAIGRPFYEVGLKCTIDTETGEVRILGVGQ